MINPLFDDEDQQQPAKHHAKKDAGYVMPNRHGKTIQPLHGTSSAENDSKSHSTHHHAASHADKLVPAKPKLPTSPNPKEKGANPAVDLIRRKLETLYSDEPDSAQEVQAITAQQAPPRSKHQQFMYELSTSGKSLAQIQTEWHNYYIGLPDDEKHQVWQEFYTTTNKHQPTATQLATPEAVEVQAAHQASTPSMPYNPLLPEDSTQGMVAVSDHIAPARPKRPAPDGKGKLRAQSAKAIKDKIVKRVNSNSQKQVKAMQHVKSLLFGLGAGAIVLVVVLFGLFNEMVIAPFIKPSSQASATPIILSTDGVAPSSTPEVIIPKISVQIPVDYSLTSNSEDEVQKGLETGIVHYPTTVKPGEKGNAAFFGHSSNNIFNPGKYKFAFVLLHELVPGDIFYLTYEGKVYSYKVFDKKVVSPNEVSVLNDVEGKQATAVLITCDPPGTALNRLVVWGEQISPDPSGATDPVPSATEQAVEQPEAITGNGPSLWKRLTGWITGE